MNLELLPSDLLPQYRSLNTSKIKFKHFNPAAQQAITVCGQGLYRWADTHNAILPPSNKGKKVVTIAVTPKELEDAKSDLSLASTLAACGMDELNAAHSLAYRVVKAAQEPNT
jgi:hypothetical protein